MGDRRTCFDCNKESPETETGYTLIDAHGWRNTRQRHADGRYTVAWRCPECWRAYKEQTGRLSTSMPAVKPQAPSREEEDPSAPFVRAAQQLQNPSGNDTGRGGRS
jgi:hypothetical protein